MQDFFPWQNEPRLQYQLFVQKQPLKLLIVEILLGSNKPEHTILPTIGQGLQVPILNILKRLATTNRPKNYLAILQTSSTATEFLQNDFTIDLNVYWPAVSQICSLQVSEPRVSSFEQNYTPIVGVYSARNYFFMQRFTRLLLPEPGGPMMITLNVCPFFISFFQFNIIFIQSFPLFFVFFTQLSHFTAVISETRFSNGQIIGYTYQNTVKIINKQYRKIVESTMGKKQTSLHKSNKKSHKKFSKGGKSNSSLNPDRVVKGNTDGKNNSLRSKATIKRLKMYSAKKPDMEKMHQRPTEAARVDPNRMWFGNVRTIDQKQLEKLRIEVAKKQQDPTKIFVKTKKLPNSLLSDPIRENKVRLLQVETYADTFGPQSRRKKVKLNNFSFDQLVEQVQNKQYKIQNDRHLATDTGDRNENRDKRMSAGQSKRIWDQLHKVLDSSDVVVQVLDARDPEGTRSKALQEHIKKNCPHKHVVLLINKADLIPVWVLAKWVKHFSKFYPTIAFKSSITKPFGKGSLINLFRQFDIFHRDKKNISIGFVGYPNVGKSSVINTLKQKKVCRAAPIPGETKVWQYITLTKRIYLIDCPGTVHVNQGKDDVESVLKGCVRAEKIDAPTYYIPHIIDKVKNPEFLRKFYGITEWEDPEDFIKKVAIKKGKLRKGGEPDLESTSKLILIDWQRGELPYYTLPEGQVDVKLEKENHNNETIDKIKQQAFLEEVGGAPVVIDEENEVQAEESNMQNEQDA